MDDKIRTKIFEHGIQGCLIIVDLISVIRDSLAFIKLRGRYGLEEWISLPANTAGPEVRKIVRELSVGGV